MLIHFGLISERLGGICEVTAPSHALFGFGAYDADVVDVLVLLAEGIELGDFAIFFCDDFARKSAVADLDEQPRIFLDAPLADLRLDLVGEVEIFEVGAEAYYDVVIRRPALFFEQRLAQSEIEFALVDVEFEEVCDRRLGRKRQIFVLSPLCKLERIAVAEVGVVEIFVVLRVDAVKDGIGDPLLLEAVFCPRQILVVGDRIEEDAPVRLAESDHHKAEVYLGTNGRMSVVDLAFGHEFRQRMKGAEAVGDQLIFVDIAQSAVRLFGKMRERRAIFRLPQHVREDSRLDIGSCAIDARDELGKLFANDDVVRIVAGVDDDVNLLLRDIGNFVLEQLGDVSAKVENKRGTLDKTCGVARLFGAVAEKHGVSIIGHGREHIDVVFVEADDDIQLLRLPCLARKRQIIYPLPEQRRREQDRVDDDQYKAYLDDSGIKYIVRHQRRRARIVKLENEGVDARLDCQPQRPGGRLAVVRVRQQIERQCREIDQRRLALFEPVQQFESLSPSARLDKRRRRIDDDPDHIDQTQNRNDIDSCHNILPRAPRCYLLLRLAPSPRLTDNFSYNRILSYVQFFDSVRMLSCGQFPSPKTPISDRLSLRALCHG